MAKPTNDAWRLDLAADDERAYAALARDAVWNGYGIADLVPPYRAYAQFAIAQRASDDALATCVILRHPVFNAIIPAGDGEGLARLLAALDLPSPAMLMVPKPLLPVLQSHFMISEPLKDMVRMQVAAASFAPTPGWQQIAERMTPADLPELEAFYDAHGGLHFNADQLGSGPFFAVRQAGRMVAGGGTQALTTRHGIAAIGNIITAPDLRGRGYASAITSAVTATLFRMGCHTVILNVVAENAPARRIYQRLGFQDYCGFWEGLATHPQGM